MNDYILERARSAASRCKGHCKMPIPKGHYRLGSISSTGFGPFWRDLNCITPRQLANIAESFGTVYAFIESRTEIPSEDKELLLRYFKAVLSEEQATREEVYAALLPRPEAPVVKVKVPRKTNKRKGAAEGKKEEDDDQDVKPAPSTQTPVPGQGEQDALPQQAAQKRRSKKKAKLAEAAPPSIVTKTDEASTNKSVGLVPPLPPQNMPTELERAILNAVATLGTADRTSVHEQLSKTMGTAYKQGPATAAINRCIGKDLLRQFAPVQACEDTPIRLQCTFKGLQALQYLTDLAAAAPPVHPMMPIVATAKAPIKKSRGTNGPPVLDAGRMNKALKEKQQCLSASLSGSADRPHGVFTVTGSKSSSQYTVELSVVDKKGHVQVSAKCSCMDARNRGGEVICKHAPFVAMTDGPGRVPDSAHVMHAAGRVLGMVLQAGQPLSVQDFITAASAYGGSSSSSSSTGATISGPSSSSTDDSSATQELPPGLTLLQPPQAANDHLALVSPTHSLADYVLPTSPDPHALLQLSQAFLQDFNQGLLLPPPHHTSASPTPSSAVATGSAAVSNSTSNAINNA